jgi:hypothetical protein
MLELLVLNVGNNWAQVHVLHRYELEKPADDMPVPQRFSVEWKGPTRKWAVIRLSDNQILQDGFASKAEGPGLGRHARAQRGLMRHDGAHQAHAL